MKNWLDALASNNAISRWSWVVTLVVALVNAPQLSAQNEVPFLPWVTAVFVVHIVSIPLLVGAKRSLRAIRVYRPRAALAIVTFLAFGAFRATALSLFAALSYSGDFADLIVGSMPSYLTISTVTLIGVAVVIDGYRQHEVTILRLETLRNNIYELRSAQEVSSQELQRELLKDVRQKIDNEISKIQVSNSGNPEETSARLRQVADSVIRPLSHELLFNEAITQIPKREAEFQIPRFFSLQDIVARAQPSNIFLVPISLELLITPFLLAQYDARIALLNIVLSTPCLVASNLLIKRFWPTKNLSLQRASRLIFAYWLAGGLCALPIYLVSKLAYWGFPLYWGNSFFFLMFTMLFISNQTLITRRDAIQEELTDAVQSEARETSKLRGRVSKLRNEIGKFLHSRVQGELIAAAIELSLRHDVDPSEVNQRIQRLTSERMEEILTPTVFASAEEELTQLVELWSSALDVKIEASSNVWNTIERRSDWKVALIDLISEGLTNAVKHSSGRTVDIKLIESIGTLEMRLISEGSLGRSMKPGGGIAPLKSIFNQIKLEELDGAVHLVAQLT
jgi:signal transduction histidine kinase